MKSWEDVPIHSYSAMGLSAGLPLAIAVYSLTELMRLYTHEEEFKSHDIPENAIIYALHCDVMGSFLANSFRKNISSVWIGFHGAASYAGSLGFVLRREPCFRYSRRLKKRPKDQIIDYLKTYNGRVYLRTDAGGPYGQVKSSLIDLALATQRPLVAVRHKFHKSTAINQHLFPLPGAILQTLHSRALYPEELKNLQESDRALKKIQELIDAI